MRIIYLDMDNMKAASNIGKQITYKFRYTNLTFDLWIILHTIDILRTMADYYIKMYV